ncbi:hypothetical protein [Cupriavidus sp. CP313]
MSSRLVLANLAPAFNLTIERETGRHRVIGLRRALPEQAGKPGRCGRTGTGLLLGAGACLHYELTPPAWPGAAARAVLSLAMPPQPHESALVEGLRSAVAQPGQPGDAPVSLALAQLVFCFPARYADAGAVSAAACCALPRLRARLFREGASLTELIRRQRAMRILFAPLEERPCETARRLGMGSIDGVETLCHDVLGVPLPVLRRAAYSASLSS